VVAVGSTGIGVLPAFLAAALAVPIGGDLSMDLGDFGLLIGVYFGIAAMGSAGLGGLVERWDWPMGIRVSAIGSFVCLIGTAAFARNAWGIGGFFVVGGLASAISHPSANLALVRSVPSSRHGLIFGLKHIAVPSATMLGGLAVPAFGLTVGWRWAFVVAAVLAVATVLAVPSNRRAPGEIGSRRTRPAYSLVALAVMAVVALLGIGAMTALATFLVAYAVDRGMAQGFAGALLAAASLSGLACRLVAGWLVDRRPHAGLPAIAALLALGAGGVVVMTTGGLGWLVGGVLLAFAAGWGWSGLFTFVVVRANPEAPAAATGITHTGIFVGSAVGPPVIGVLVDHGSFAAAWWLAAAMLTLAAVLTLGVWLGGRSPSAVAARRRADTGRAGTGIAKTIDRSEG